MPDLEVVGPDLRLVHFDEPTLELVEIAEAIGYEAWLAQLDRSEEEIRHTFNPDSPESAEKLFSRMQEKDGKFEGVVGLIGEKAVGYAWAAEDQSASKAKHIAKKLIGVYSKPYIWLAQINVLPEYQGNKVGSALMWDTLASFDQSLKPTAYVFKENQRSLNWFMSRGFELKPTEPEPKYNYFGIDTEPADQFRLEGFSTGSVYRGLRRRGYSRFKS